MTDHDHISDLRWDRLLAGELSEEERAAVHAHAAACATCSGRHRALIVERDAFTLRPPVRLAPAPVRRRRWLAAAPVVALAAAAVLIVFARKPIDGERTKGSDQPTLLLSAGQPGKLVPVMSNDTIHPGDYLQAGYSAKRDGFGAVLALDGSGQAMSYVPPSGDTLIALPAGAEQSFPASTVLDDIVGTERVAIVWCEAPRPLAPLVAELRATQQLGARSGCTIRIVVLTKVAR